MCSVLFTAPRCGGLSSTVVEDVLCVSLRTSCSCVSINSDISQIGISTINYLDGDTTFFKKRRQKKSHFSKTKVFALGGGFGGISKQTFFTKRKHFFLN